MPKAIVFSEYGGPEVLRLVDVDEPHPGPGRLRARVKMASVNRFDVKQRRGDYETTLPHVPGLDFAGVVDELGEGVSEWMLGDEVLGWATGGSYAELAVAEHVVRKPAAMPWEQAAALPTTGETACRVLHELGLGTGETLLVHGAAGGVGTFAVQIARARGATVIGTASETNHDYLRSLGAIPVAYGDGLVERVRQAAPNGVDAVFDTAGRGALPASIELAGGSERVITISDPQAEELGVRVSSARRPELLAELVKLWEAGRLRVEVEQTFSLAEAAEAHRLSEGGHVRGKLVLTTER